MTVLVTVNGDQRELPAGATVWSVIESLSTVPEGRGLAVAVDGVVVPRGAWSRTELTNGVHVEVLTAVQGG